MGISGVGSFPVQSGGSLIIFQLFRCRDFALNRFFPTFLRGRHVLYLGDVWMPLCLYTSIYLHVPCTFICPLGV